MKKMKKILAFVMAMAMVLGMSVTALAAPDGYGDDGVKRDIETTPATGTKSDTGTITISNVTPNPEESEKTLTVTAYQIIKAEYKNDIPEGSAEEDTGKFSGYADVYTAEGLPKFVSATGVVDNSTITEENLATIRAYIEEQNVAGTTMNPVDETNGTQYSASGVKVGTYLVVISGAEGKIYSNMVVSVQYVNEDGSGNFVESADLFLTEGMALAKVQSNPKITKKIVEGDDKKAGNSANIGEIVKYEITADIPTYSGSNPVYKVSDTLVGLCYKDNLTVKVVDASGNIISENVKYTIENEEGNVIEEKNITNKIILNFVSEADGVKTYNLSEYAGKKLVITYDAIVDKATANVNQKPNTNTVELEYTHNSNVSGDDETDKTDDITKTYTFDLSGTLTGDKETSILTKTGESTSSTTEKLGGAEFKLYQKDDEGNEIAYINTAMTERVELEKVGEGETPTMTTKVTSSKEEGNKGELIIRGLAAGTYYLKEVKAPDGYSLSDHEYTIIVSATINDEGELTDWDVTVDGDKLFAVVAGEVTVEANRENNGHIPNTKLSTLPSTGGIGTTIFTIGGCAIMIIAAGLYFASRRKSAK